MNKIQQICGDGLQDYRLNENELNINIPRVLVGAIQGRSGKTTFTLGLLKALVDRGLAVQPFKKGPDYIDPSWMTFASGQQCRNLDLFMMGADRVRSSFVRNSQGFDISVVEGAMGLFDGLDVDGSNSSAELAYTIDAPVILVVNCTRITRSVAALVNGVTGFDKRIQIGGVILNQVARARHENIMIESIKKYCDVPVLGVLPKNKAVEIPDRHLGLIPAGEQDMLHTRIETLGNLVKENVDLEALLRVAQHARPLELSDAQKTQIVVDTHNRVTDKVKLGIVRDKAFSFYYPENIEALEDAGAELVAVDALHDGKLPDDICGLYIGGGFPEVMAEEISANRSLLEDIKAKADAGFPIYAECGGLMFLSRNIIDGEAVYPMTGVFDCDVEMTAKPQGIGYTIQRVLPGNPFYAEGDTVIGHEFHNSRVVNMGESLQYGFATERGKCIKPGFDALVYKNTMAGYHHLHVYGAPEWADNFCNLVRIWKENGVKQ
ncbi:MAG: cobyrinate a,c-diamide synthase [Peptococcaceae bacterium]|nr:cobyrinate a,c-diamide synthase [Peptococcaceae bacterium]